MKKFIHQKELPGFYQGSNLISKIHLLYRRVPGIKVNPASAIIFFLLTCSFLVSCREDDQVMNVEKDHELDQLRTIVEPYKDLQKAIKDGYDNEFTGYRTQMGYHYLKGSLLDNKFEIDQPEVLLYAPDAKGDLQFVAVEYAVPIEDMDNPPLAPEGFSGDADVWEINAEFKVWTLHVWIGMDNPHGIFHSHNPNLP